jgi:hypothetical protein
VVSEKTASNTLSALTRFVERRGISLEVTSDEGPTFKAIAAAINGDTSTLLVLDNWTPFKDLKWCITPGNSTHINGLAEAKVKAVNSHLSHRSGCQSLSNDEFYTTVIRVEAILESRPKLLAIISAGLFPFAPYQLLTGHLLMPSAFTNLGNITQLLKV